jgi:glutamyl-Q tRNA(Asp) synthetase
LSYIGRFAPSPTGPLHAGSLVAALASYLDARAHQGRWLIRIEDIDETRTVVGADDNIIYTLSALGMHSDEKIIWQSQRKSHYEAAFIELGNMVYPCACSRKEIADSRVSLSPDGAAIYPRTCRAGLAAGRTARSWRIRVPNSDESNNVIEFNDRWQGLVRESLSDSVGDFVLRRADGFWAYQLAVVVDDADQEITHVVRGADLLHSTARQIYLQRLLKKDVPQYLHVPVMTNECGEKLSKQTGAQAVDISQPVSLLMDTANTLGLTINPSKVNSVQTFFDAAVPAWARRFKQ